MNIINKGKNVADFAEAVPWWVGLIVECDRCGFSAELELRDENTNGKGEVNAFQERKPGGAKWVSMGCPNCHKFIRAQPGGSGKP